MWYHITFKLLILDVVRYGRIMVPRPLERKLNLQVGAPLGFSKDRS